MSQVAKAIRHHQKHPLPNPKNHGGGNFKKYAKGFSGGAQHGFAVLGGGAELTSFARNRFALNRKTPPN